MLSASWTSSSSSRRLGHSGERATGADVFDREARTWGPRPSQSPGQASWSIRLPRRALGETDVFDRSEDRVGHADLEAPMVGGADLTTNARRSFEAVASGARRAGSGRFLKTNRRAGAKDGAEVVGTRYGAAVVGAPEP